MIIVLTPFVFFITFFGFRFQRGLKRKPMALIKKLRKAVGVSFTFALSLVLNCVMRCLCRSACACIEL